MLHVRNDRQPQGVLYSHRSVVLHSLLLLGAAMQWGELCLELDNGAEITVTPGTCVVQRGTRHAWKNKSDRPAFMCYVQIGARAGLTLVRSRRPVP